MMKFEIFSKAYMHLKIILSFILLKRKCPYLLCTSKTIALNSIVDKGVGNAIILMGRASLKDCSICFYGNNCTLRIGQNAVIYNNDFCFEDEGGEIVIGDNTTTESGCKFASCEGKRIVIGDDCMLSHDVDVRNTDSHSILNDRGERINASADILIGDHVWIGIRSTLLKGSVIPSQCVVAAQSMVTSSLNANEHTIIAGSPARVIKTGVSWDRKRLSVLNKK